MKRTWLIYAAIACAFYAVYFGIKTMDRKTFAATIKAALNAVNLRGLNPAFLAALAAHETGWGSGNVFSKTRNLFSITKGSTWTGETYSAVSGYIFRMYGTYAASVADFVNLIYTLSRYAPARNATSIKQFAQALQSAGYGDPKDANYAAEIESNYNAIKGYFA